MFLKLLNTDVFKFIFTKYFAYGLQFIVVLIIADKLGLYFFGIYGFVTLLLQYLLYSNLGINHSLNVMLATNKGKDEEFASTILTTTLSINATIAIILFFFVLIGYFSGIFELFPKYLLSEYIGLVILIAIVEHFNNIFINLFRIYGKISEINYKFLFLPIGQLSCIFFFEQKKLFWALIISMLITNSIALIVFVIRSPLKINIKLKFPKKISREVIRRGIFLLTYNLSFYLIVMSARSIVSYFYSVEEFAQFNFANSLTNAVMMLLGSMSFLFFPKMLNKFSEFNKTTEIISFIEKTRKIYLTITFLTVFLSLLFAPLIYYIIPDYTDSFKVLKYLLVSQLIITNSFGYTALLIQKKKEKTLTFFGLISVGIVVTSGVIFGYLLKFPFEYIAISVLLSVLVYNFLVIYLGNKITNQFSNFFLLLKYTYSYNYMIPIILYLVLGLFFFNSFIITAVSIASFLILNDQNIIYAFKTGLSIVTKKNALSIIAK